MQNNLESSLSPVQARGPGPPGTLAIIVVLPDATQEGHIDLGGRDRGRWKGDSGGKECMYTYS